MYDFEKFSDVLERRKDLIGVQRLSCCVYDYLHSGQLDNVCHELDIDSYCGRNWKGLADHLIEPSPDANTINKWAKYNSPAYEMLCVWVADDNCDFSEQTTFAVLLDAMITNQSYSAADELLCYLETQMADIPNETEEIKKPDASVDCKQVEEQGATAIPQLNITSTTDVQTPSTGTYKRSKSLVDRLKRVGKRFRRSESYPPDNVPGSQTQLELTKQVEKPIEKPKNEIFIVCSSKDNESEAMRNLKSFVNRLERVRSGAWLVATIHDLPVGNTTSYPDWLREREERAVYVIICCSKIIKEINDSTSNGSPLLQQPCDQSERNLNLILKLVTTKLYRNMGLNIGGKYLPVVLPGNDLTCVMDALAVFKVFTWPQELKGIRNYMMGRPERQMPKLGKKIELLSHRVP